MGDKVLEKIVMLMIFYCHTTLEDNTLYNVALYKPAFQSSVFNGWGANNGNDNRKSGKANDGQCMHTTNESNSWWIVDLMDTYVISSIFLINRNEKMEYKMRLNHFQIDIFKDDPRLLSTFPSASGDICYEQTEAATNDIYTWSCSKPLVGRYVRLLRYLVDMLTICEFQVMTYIIPLETADFKVYKDKILNQTSILEYTASRPWSCGSQCLEKRYTDGCSAFNWFLSTRLCQLLNVDPRDVTVVTTLLSVPGVRFYIIQY